MRRTRSPIVVVLGHVDVGKTTLLDRIRGTAVASREPGTMTQHIGASFLSWSALESICEPLAEFVRGRVSIPGLLVIDTPGHEAFANLRSRGGSIADIAVLVIDVLKGFEKQTRECIEILKSRKVPFVIAANKVDRIPGWKPIINASIAKSIGEQDGYVVDKLDELLYKVMGEMSKLGFRSDRYDRIRDFSKTVAMIPTSALTGEGIPDLLLVLAGISQRFLIERLWAGDGGGRGVILEVKEEVGLGTTIDVILYDGTLRRGDTIVVGTLDKPLVTKIKALLMPKPMDEMRSPEDRFLTVDEVSASSGIKIVASGLEGSVAGAPVLAAKEVQDVDRLVEEVSREVSEVRFSTNIDGVIVKADALGSLEALSQYMGSYGIPVRYADVGPICKRDVIEASLVKEREELYGTILAFNVRILPDAEEEAMKWGVKIFREEVIYRLVEGYLDWVNRVRGMRRDRELAKLIRPGKLKILPGYVFRRSDPAIIGIEVIAGLIRPGYTLIKSDGREVGTILQIQEHGESLPEATKGMEVAISIKGRIVVGRHIKEGDVLYVDVPREHASKLITEFRDGIGEEEIDILKEIYRMKRMHVR